MKCEAKSYNHLRRTIYFKMFSVFLFVICMFQCVYVCVLAQETYTNENSDLMTIPTHIPSNVTILNLKNNKLQQLPQLSLDNFTDLEEIYLTSNLIETLENNVFNPSVHQNLSIISMGNNRIREMPVLDGFQLLRILDVSNNELQNITIGILDNLEELILNGNNLDSMPLLTEQLPRLQTILLQHNNIVSLSPDYFNKTPSLKKLDLSRNFLNEITLEHNSLTEIRLSHNNLYAMPVVIQSLTSLTILVLNDNPISFIPEQYFINTPALLTLNMNQTKLTEFNCTGLNKIHNLYLDNTLLAEFPNITNCFASLRVFRMRYIWGNFIVPGIDKALVFGSSLTSRRASHLHTFQPRGTPIGDLPDWFLYALPNLKNMDIASTKLTEMPDISTNTKYVLRYLICNTQHNTLYFSFNSLSKNI